MTTTPTVVELQVADDARSWADAGFAANDDLVWLGSVAVRLTGAPDDGPRGITGWTLAGIELEGSDLDGLPTTVVAEPTTSAADQANDAHPNGVTGLDHIVVATSDLERTLAALAAAGLDLRRIRDTTSNGSPMRQAFFRLGPTILEVVSGDTGSGLPAADSPSTWFGLAVDCADLDQTAAMLGDAVGSIKPAVQRGRRIATLRHRKLGLSVPVAAMDDHADR